MQTCCEMPNGFAAHAIWPRWRGRCTSTCIAIGTRERDGCTRRTGRVSVWASPKWGGDTLECCEVRCCVEICCGGEHCDCSEYVVGHSQCRVCGQFSTLHATPPEGDFSAVQQDPLVIAAEQHGTLMKEELCAAFDAAVDQWTREVGVRRF